MAQTMRVFAIKRMYILILAACLAFICATGLFAKPANTPDSPVGYVAFFNCTGLIIDIYSVQEKIKTHVDFNSIHSMEYRIAKKPGNYTFIITSSEPWVTEGCSCTITVQIVANTITYATLQKFKISNPNPNAVLSFSYVLWMTQGGVRLPVHSGPDNIRDLQATLDDEDMGTRFAGLDALEKICTQNPKVTISGLTDKLIGLYYQERYPLIAVKIEDLMGELGYESKLKDDNDFFYLTTFTSNTYSYWHTDKDTRYFNAGGYNLDNKSKDAIWSYCDIDPNLPENFDVELTSTWKSGVTDYTYGLMMGSRKMKSFYEFGITKNGRAGTGLWQAQKHVKDIISWKPVNSITTAKNIIKIEVRGKRIKYSVNDALIGTINNDGDMVVKSFGMLVQEKQWVCFNFLKIIRR